MKKYIMKVWEYEYPSIAVVEAKDLNEAFVKFIEYFGIPYPFEYKDVANLMKDFTTQKFIKYFENEKNYRVYGIYQIEDIIFEKVVEQ